MFSQYKRRTSIPHENIDLYRLINGDYDSPSNELFTPFECLSDSYSLKVSHVYNETWGNILRSTSGDDLSIIKIC